MLSKKAFEKAKKKWLSIANRCKTKNYKKFDEIFQAISLKHINSYKYLLKKQKDYVIYKMNFYFLSEFFKNNNNHDAVGNFISGNFLPKYNNIKQFNNAKQDFLKTYNNRKTVKINSYFLEDYDSCKMTNFNIKDLTIIQLNSCIDMGGGIEAVWNKSVEEIIYNGAIDIIMIQRFYDNNLLKKLLKTA